MKLRIYELSRQFCRDTFNSGNTDLNDYLQKYALQNTSKGISNCFVLAQEGSTDILGYYTLSAAEIRYEELPDSEAKKIPKYGVGASLIGRLAVDQTHQRQQLGTLLLMDALFRIHSSSKQIGIWAVIVDAKNEAAEKFYRKYGFTKLMKKDRERLFLPIRVVELLLAAQP